MALNDRYGLPLSAASSQAADAYVKAADQLLAAGADLLAGFDAALDLDDGFALAEIGRARCLATYGQGTAAKAAATRARVLVKGATRRERGHVEALALAVEGRVPEALAAIKAHLAEFPRDAMVLQPATGVFGLIGLSGRREREAELLALLDDLAAGFGDDWWFMSIHAFAECEAGRLTTAEQRVERALAAAPHNANAAHVRAHVHYELGEAVRGAAFLRSWLPGYSPAGLLRGHLSWHLALWELGAGRRDAAHALYEREIAPTLRGGGAPTPPLNLLTDVVSWLWRSQLRGEAGRDDDWRLAAAFAAERFPQAGVTFADVHAALAYARMGDDAALDRLLGQLMQLAGDRPASALAATLASGFAAHVRGDWAAAARQLGADRGAVVRIGGSRAQRELVDRSVLDAFRRAGLEAETAALFAARPQVVDGV